MKLALKKPEVVGAVSEDAFDMPPTIFAEKTSALSSGAPKLISSMLEVSGEEIANYEQALIRTRTVEPGLAVPPEEVAEWHMDPTQDLVCSNVLCTQFLYGSLMSVRDFLRIPKRRQLHPDRFDTMFLFDLSRKLAKTSDEELVEQYGFGIWTPEPLEVVRSFRNIHRAPPTNELEEPVSRTVGLIFRG